MSLPSVWLQGKDLTTCAVDTQNPQKAILGRSSGKISMLDVQTGQLLETVPPSTLAL